MAILWKAGREMTQDFSKAYPWPEIPRPTFDGVVLGTIVKVDRIMSDVYADSLYAIVWNGERIEHVCVGNCEFGHDGKVVVDASDEVKAAAAAWTKAQEDAATYRRREGYINKHIEEARRVAVGKEVEVVKGRKVKIGTTGRVFWTGNGQYGERAGLELSSGERIFIAVTNLSVSHPEEYMDVEAAIASLKK